MAIDNDNCPELQQKHLYDIYFQDKIKILEINLPGKGLVNSIKLCLHWRSLKR
jgi:hypothetical protein